MTEKALCIGGVAHGLFVYIVPGSPSVFRHPKQVCLVGHGGMRSEEVYDEYDLRFRTNAHGRERPVYVLKNMPRDAAAYYSDALLEWFTETKPEGVSWREPKLTPADAVRIVEAYEALHERAIEIMKLPEFRQCGFNDDVFYVVADPDDERSLIVEWYDPQKYYFETYNKSVSAELFEMGGDDFVLHAAMLDRQDKELQEQQKREQTQAAEAKERAEYERLRKKFEDPQR